MSQMGNRCVYINNSIISHSANIRIMQHFSCARDPPPKVCTPFFSYPPFPFPLHFFRVPLSHWYPSFPSIISSFSVCPITWASFIPFSSLQTSHSRLHGWGCNTKKLPPPPGSLSRSDVTAWEEWRRCIHESGRCSPQERSRQRGTGGVRGWQMGNRRLSKKAGRRARNEMRQGNGSGKGGDWERQMKRGNVRGDRLMNECLCTAWRGQCQFTTASECFKLKWYLERGWRGSHLDSKLSLVFIFKSLLSGGRKKTTTPKWTEQII